MKVWYQDGELKQKFGKAGEFMQGVPRDIPDDLAKDLLRKGRVMIWPEPEDKADKRKK